MEALISRPISPARVSYRLSATKPAEKSGLKRGLGAVRGFGLTELLIAVIVITILLLGLGQFLVSVIRSGSTNAYRVEVLNAVRSKLDEVKSIPYDQVGVQPTNGTSGAGYFETDPLYAPTFGAGDTPLSDRVELSRDGLVERSVSVAIIDDPADATGNNDWDQVTDPNTETILDYKIVTVSITATDPANQAPFTMELSTLMVGTLDSEVDSAGDSVENRKIGKKPPKNKKDKTTGDPKKGKEKKNKKGRDGKSQQDGD